MHLLHHWYVHLHHHLTVPGERFIEVRVRGQVIDEVQELPPLARTPEAIEVDPAKCEIGLNRLTVAGEIEEEAVYSPCVPIP